MLDATRCQGLLAFTHGVPPCCLKNAPLPLVKILESLIRGQAHETSLSSVASSSSEPSGHLVHVSTVSALITRHGRDSFLCRESHLGIPRACRDSGLY